MCLLAQQLIIQRPTSATNMSKSVLSTKPSTSSATAATTTTTTTNTTTSTTSLSQNNNDSRKRPRRVSFATTTTTTSASFTDVVLQVSLIPIPSPVNQLLQEESDPCKVWSTVWYKQEDLDAFRTEARNLCRQLRFEVGASAVVSSDDDEDTSASKQRPSSKLLLARDCSDDDDTDSSDSESDLAVVEDASERSVRGLESRCCLERQRRKYLTNKYIVKASQHPNLSAERLAALSTKCTQYASRLAVQEAHDDYLRAYPMTKTLKRNVPDSNTATTDVEQRRVRPRLETTV